MQVRDWLHVADHCEAIALVLRHGMSGEVYNVGGNSETTNIDLVHGLCAVVDDLVTTRDELSVAFPGAPAAEGKQAKSLVRHVRDRPGHDRRYAINFAKAKRELGYCPQRDLAAGLRSTVEWYLENAQWWQALLGREYTEWVNKNY